MEDFERRLDLRKLKDNLINDNRKTSPQISPFQCCREGINVLSNDEPKVFLPS